MTATVAKQYRGSGWKKVTAALVVAGAAAVAVPSVMAASYVIQAGATQADPLFPTLAALYTAHNSLGTDSIQFKNNDSTLTSSFAIASGATLTLSGTATIGAASTVRFISTTNAFTLAAATGSKITFSGFTQTSGNGAVLFNSGGNITLGTAGTGGTLIFNNNTVNLSGGAISTSTTATIAGDTNTFTNNKSGNSGGAISANTALTISGGTNTFTSNEVTGSGNGGAINAATTTISGGTNTFTGNKTTGNASGGAINATTAMTISGGTNTFTSNKSGYGGAISASGTLSITDSKVSFINNEATGNGGAIFTWGAVTLHATNGDIKFQGNVDSTGTPANTKANAIDMRASSTATRIHSIVAQNGRKVEFFDPIVSVGTGFHTFNFNNTSSDTGTVIFDGSYWKSQGKTPAANANYFTSKLLGNTTVDYGTLEIKNGAMLDITGTLTVSANGTLSVVADKVAANAPIVNGGAFTVNGSLVVDANATQLKGLVKDEATNFYFAKNAANVSIAADKVTNTINTQLYTVDDYEANDNFIVITKKGGEIHYVSSSVGAAFASYTPNGGNAIFDDVHTNTLGEYNDAERVEMSYNAASHVGAAQQGAAALSGVYGVMDGVFSGNFEHGGGGVYRGQVCDPCAPADGRSRLERSVWVMPIYGHQSAAGLHSGGVHYGYTSDQYAAVFGTEVKRGHTRFGIAGNVGIGRAVSPGAVVHTNSDLTFGGVSLYAVQKFGKVESNAQVGWIGTRNEMRQNNAGVRVNADIDGGVIYAAIGFERPYHVGHLTLAPIFGLEFTHLYQNSFATKAGGTAIFNAQSGNANMLHLPLGLKASANYRTRFGNWSPSVRARVLPHVGDHELAFTNLSTGSTTAATLHGIVSDAVAGDVTFGSTLKRGHTELGGAYTLLFSEHFTNQNVGLVAKKKF